MSATGGYDGGPTPYVEKPVKERIGYIPAFLVILVLAALVGAGWWYAHDQAVGRIPHGTKVAGVDIGGLDRQQAVGALRQGLADRVAEPITLSVEGKAIQVSPVVAGMTVDYPASVDRAVTPDSWDPTDLWNYFTGSDDLQPVVTIDQTKLRTEVTRLAQRLGVPSRDAGIRFTDGRIRRIPAQNGEGLDVDAVSSALAKAYLSDTDVADVTLVRVPPRITDAKVQAALNTKVNPALSSPVTLVFSGRPVRLRPTDYQGVLTLVPQGGDVVLSVDQAKLVALVEPTIGGRSAPLDATVKLVGGKPEIVPARRGTTYAPTDIARVFLSLLDQPAKQRRGAVPPNLQYSQFTNADARALRIVKPVSRYTTTFSPGQVDLAALNRQVAAINGTVLHPNDVFSFAKTSPPDGADTSQLATTIYNAAFFAGLEDVTHTAPQPHVARFPLGREATVVAGGPDLRFRDDTSYGVLIQAVVTSGRVTVTLWSTPVWRITSATSCAPAAGSDAFEVVTSRVFRYSRSSQVDHIQKTFTNYTGLSARTCRTAGAQG